MRILVNPDQLQSLSARLQQVAGDLRAVESRVGSALGGLDWEARQKVGMEGQVAHARSQARALAAQAEEMARYLAGKAQAFEEADGQGVGRIGEVAGAFTEIQGQWMQGPGVRYSFPHLQIETQMRLGQISEVQPDRPVLVPTPTPTPVPVVPGGEATIVDLAALTALSARLSATIGDFVERVWNWVLGKGFKTSEEIQAEEEREQQRQEEERKRREEQRKRQEKERQGEETAESSKGGTAISPASDISQAGLEFIAKHEGVVLELYNDPAGNCTIGVGHLVHYGPCDGRASEAEFADGISKEQAYELLRRDAARFAQAVRDLVKVILTQNQFDALVSFAYNVGIGALKESDLLKKLNQGDYDSIPNELLRWNKVTVGGKRVESRGLTKRRQEEAALFRDGTY